MKTFCFNRKFAWWTAFLWWRTLLHFSLTIKRVCHFRSRSIFCLGCRTISRRAARRLIVWHPEQNIEVNIEDSVTMPSKISCSSGKGLNLCSQWSIQKSILIQSSKLWTWKPPIGDKGYCYSSDQCCNIFVCCGSRSVRLICFSPRCNTISQGWGWLSF